ncbi:MAG TPA: hypothetical protein VF483_07010, partial [Gemmatimonadaceae bacterium]
MRRVMVRYTTKPEHAEENARLAREVYAALHRTKPAGLKYTTYRLDDGVSFVHISEVEDGENNPLQQVPEFKAFTAGVKERCSVPPVTTHIEEVGSF